MCMLFSTGVPFASDQVLFGCIDRVERDSGGWTLRKLSGDGTGNECFQRCLFDSAGVLTSATKHGAMRITTHTPMIALLGFLTFLSTALAIQANLAGIVDWHKPLIGLPVLDPTPPTLVESSAGRRVVSITKSNVLAVMNAEDGGVGELCPILRLEPELTLVWRYQLEDADPVVSYHIRDDGRSRRPLGRRYLTYPVVILLSGPSGTTVRLFSLETGGVRWEKPLHSSAGAHLTSPVHLGTDVDFTADGSSVVILSDGRRITKLGMVDGKLEWSLEAPGAGYARLCQTR